MAKAQVIISNEALSQSKGFTLVELSIVMVIVGLLVAGVVAGANILESSRLRGVITEVHKYKVAIDAFSETYNGLPGDLENATDFWPAAADCTAPYLESDGSTCNGNGDGRVGNGGAGDDTEPYTLWDQLALARMISGYYTGAGTQAELGENSPASINIDGAGFSFSFFTNAGFTDSLGRSQPDNCFGFGRPHQNRNDYHTAAITPEGAYYIDAKMDDGTPDFGKVYGDDGFVNFTSGAFASCVTGNPPDAEYDLQVNEVSCMMRMCSGTIFQ